MNRRGVTLKDIAERCGTTVPTVSYVLSESQKRYVNRVLRERIRRCAEELGYVPRQRRQAEGETIAIVLPQLENVFFRRMIRGIEEASFRANVIPAFYHTEDSAAREKDVLRHVASRGFGGYLLVPSNRSGITSAMLAALRKPLVVAERPLPCEGEYDFFAMDNYHAGFEATRELIRAGHRHIGMITWNNTALTLLDRHVGYARALEEADIPYRPEYVYTGMFSEEDGYRMTRELLANQPELTAIVYAYHVPAQGGVRYLTEAGIAVPEALSVVIAGDPAWVDMTTPVVTHMTLPSYSVGEKAAERLLARMRGGPDKAERMTLRGTLVRGGSVRQIG